jgi:hypothetical protein
MIVFGGITDMMWICRRIIEEICQAIDGSFMEMIYGICWSPDNGYVMRNLILTSVRMGKIARCNSWDLHPQYLLVVRKIFAKK